MSASSTGDIVRTVYSIYNDRAFDRVGEHLTDDFELTNVATGETFRGASGMRQFLEGWASAFPESRVDITRTVAAEDSAAVEFTGRGVQTGTLRTPAGDIPATGKSVEVSFCDVHEIRNGKISRTRSYFDVGTMMRQLGVTS